MRNNNGNKREHLASVDHRQGHIVENAPSLAMWNCIYGLGLLIYCVMNSHQL